MVVAKIRVVALVATLCASGQGCSMLKTFQSHDEDAKSAALSTASTGDTNTNLANPIDKRISLLHAKASLAEMDNLPAEAIQAYESILAMDAGNVAALHRLALLHIQKQEYENAEAKFQAAMRCAPENALLCNDYGYFCHLQNRPAEAILHLTKAVELNPDYLAAHNNLGLVLAGEGQQDAAERHFKLAKCDQAEALNNIALVRFMQSDLDDATSFYNQALQVNPNQTQARSSLSSLQRLSKLDPTATGTSVARSSTDMSKLE